MFGPIMNICESIPSTPRGQKHHLNKIKNMGFIPSRRVAISKSLRGNRDFSISKIAV